MKSAKYGTIINISVPYDYVGVISDTNGLVVCEVEKWAETFVGQSGSHIDLKIDMETGAILNWTPFTRDQIVDLIEKNGG